MKAEDSGKARGRGGWRAAARALHEKGILPKVTMFWHFMFLVFFITFAVSLIMCCMAMLANRLGFLPSEGKTVLFVSGMVVVACLLLSLLLTLVANRLVLVPMHNIISAIEEVGRGNFDVRILSDDKREIGSLARSLNRMIESLGSLETMRSDFIANVSHEFKTPIASIQGCAALLQDEALTPDERRQYTELIYNSAKRLSVLSTNILELSKLEHGEVEVRRDTFKLDEHLRQALLILQSDWQAKDIELDLDLPEVQYYGSDELLMQVWLNLLGNAIKFSEQGGTVHVTLEKLSSAVAVTVRDEGVGIEQAEQRLIFDKFYQADTSHKTEGNGLGLAMVRQIVTLLGADIEVVSAPGEGAAFTVVLPVEAARG
jgi:signal transduction histidine kinase